MKAITRNYPKAAAIALVALCLSAAPAPGEQFGLFTYSVVGDTVRIDDYPENEVGDVEIPNEIDGKPVIEIGQSAFSGCSGLTSVTIPEGVTSFGSYAFSGCSGLTSVTIPEGVTSMGSYAFRDCTGLTTVSIPGSVPSIGYAAFSRCSGLTTVTIPEGVTYIGPRAFDGCTGLASVTIPEGVTGIGSYAFFGCSGLVSVTIPEGVTSIAGSAFHGCSGLVSVTIPGSVTEIGSYAFYGCSGLVSVTIPDGVTSIGGAAFFSCSGLTKISIPEGVSYIGGDAFDGCRSLTLIEVDPENQSYMSMDGVLINQPTMSLIRCPEGKAGPYVIPAGVRTIRGNQFGTFRLPGGEPSGAFGNCRQLTILEIPESVSKIERGAFEGCSGLVSIRVAPENNFYASREGVLFNASETDLIQFPSAKAGHYAIPEGTINIVGFVWDSVGAIGIPSIFGSGAFNGCTGLIGVTIPESITSIGCGAFSGCASLATAIFLGRAPSSLDSSTFEDAASDFTVYYLSCSTGFTSPTWNGYPTIRIDERACPAAPWLVGHGLPYDTDLNQDLNGDGVSLLMAYALDLDPRLNLSSRLPVPVIDTDTLTMSFHAASPGLTYSAETSTDLRTWRTDGVTLSGLDAENKRTATVSLDSPQRFLRLVVE